MTEGYKKKDIGRARQPIQIGHSVSSKDLDGSITEDRIELGFPAEKLTIVTTGDLAANVQPLVGPANSNTVIAASTTPSTTILSHMTSSVTITRTSGSGKVIILAK